MSGVPESGAPPSLNCAGTGGVGWWYFGPTVQPAKVKSVRASAPRLHILILLSVSGSRLHRDAHTVGEKIRRVGNHGVRRSDSRHDLNRVAEVVAERYFAKLGLIVSVHYAHLRPV